MCRVSLLQPGWLLLRSQWQDTLCVLQRPAIPPTPPKAPISPSVPPKALSPPIEVAQWVVIA